MNLAGALIAGGQSSRFGQDKAFLQFQGQSLAARLLGAMRQAGCSPLIFNGSRAPDDLGADVQVLADEQPGMGPLGGLATVLAQAQGPVLVAACDMPGLNAEAMRSLMAAYAPGKGGLVSEGEGGLEPLFAIYEPSLLPKMREALAKGQRALYRMVEGEGLPRFALPNADWVRNVNDRGQWERWTQEHA